MAFGLRSKTFILKPFLRMLDAMGLPMLPTPMNPTETAMVISFARWLEEHLDRGGGPSIASDSPEVYRGNGARAADVNEEGRSLKGTGPILRWGLPRRERPGVRGVVREQRSGPRSPTGGEGQT